MNKKTFRWLWALTIIAAFGIGCNLVSNVTQRVGGVEKTAQSVATGLQSGREIITTGQALATNIGGNSIVQTAQAFVTEQAPGVEKTVQAFATNQGPGLEQTIQALATQSGSTTGQAPQDIPLVEGDKTNLVTSGTFVTYFTSMDFKSVLSFYETQMPVNGWTKVDNESVQSGNSAVLVYDKPSRKATVTLGVNPTDNSTVVAISISQK